MACRGSGVRVPSAPPRGLPRIGETLPRFPNLSGKGCDPTKGAWPLVRRPSRMYPVCCGRGPLSCGPADNRFPRAVGLLRRPAPGSSRSVVGVDFQLFARSDHHEPRTGESSAGAVVCGVGGEARVGLGAATLFAGRSVSQYPGPAQFAGPLVPGFWLAQFESFVTFQGLF